MRVEHLINFLLHLFLFLPVLGVVFLQPFILLRRIFQSFELERHRVCLPLFLGQPMLKLVDFLIFFIDYLVLFTAYKIPILVLVDDQLLKLFVFMLLFRHLNGSIL